MYIDLLLSINSGNCAILILLLPQYGVRYSGSQYFLFCLQYGVGVNGTAMNWSTSYLKHRSFSVNIKNFSSPKLLSPMGAHKEAEGQCSSKLHTIAKIKSFLLFKDPQKVIHYFISSRFDYCNSLYTGILPLCWPLPPGC